MIRFINIVQFLRGRRLTRILRSGEPAPVESNKFHFLRAASIGMVVVNQSAWSATICA